MMLRPSFCPSAAVPSAGSSPTTERSGVRAGTPSRCMRSGSCKAGKAWVRVAVGPLWFDDANRTRRTCFAPKGIALEPLLQPKPSERQTQSPEALNSGLLDPALFGLSCSKILRVRRAFSS